VAGHPPHAGPDGNAWAHHTRGVLVRRSVYLAYVKYIGNESNQIEEVEHQEGHDRDEVLEEYHDPRSDPWFTLVVPILKLPDMKCDELAKLAGVEPLEAVEENTRGSDPRRR